MSDVERTYLQAASVETILGEIIDGHMIFKRDGTVYDFSPDCDKMTFNERQCCNELLRRFAALEVERDQATRCAMDMAEVVTVPVRNNKSFEGDKAVRDFLKKYPQGLSARGATSHDG